MLFLEIFNPSLELNYFNQFFYFQVHFQSKILTVLSLYMIYTEKVFLYFNYIES
jgi:hypothetical protein